MVGVHTFFLGLGLFFAGLLMTGDRMRHIAGKAFHKVALRVASPVFGATVGVGFGALMQSATAVTFILVSMVRSGLITAVVALPIILWANVGLTALSFVATFNIHSVVAWIVGLAGIALGLLKIRVLMPWAGLVFGIGLILFGLETMGEGAAPLKNAEWFKGVLAMTSSSAAIAFLVGMLAAAILQSNVGTTLLVVTLAEAGALSLETSAMIVYGSNLGAIFLRIFLSLGMDRASFRLVRFEDFFCVWSGVVMALLYVLEMAGVPLVLALVRRTTPQVDLQVAGIFFLSNLIPAFLLHLWRNRALVMLTRVWPGEFPEDHSKPKFINDTALDHPPTAIELAQKELARLMSKIRARCEESDEGKDTAEFESHPDFTKLAQSIDGFLSELISRNDLNRPSARAVQLQRAELSMTRYLDEAVEQLSQYVTQASAASTLQPHCLEIIRRINMLVELAVRAAQELTPESIQALHVESDKKHAINISLRETLKSKIADAIGEESAAAEAADENFNLSLWVLRRFSKLLLRVSAESALVSH